MNDDTFYCTLVSMVPFPIREEKPGLVPSVVHIPAAEKDNFVVVHVKPCFYPMYIDEARGSFNVPVPPDQLAKSIIDDFVNAQLGVDRHPEHPASPGMFFVVGKLTKEQIKKEYPDAVQEALNTQKEWFRRLVQSADDDWQRYRQHKTISDLQRHAAKSLGLERDWLVVTKDAPMTPISAGKTCPACFSTVHPQAIICPQCRCVMDAKAYAAMKFAPVGGESVASTSK